MHNILLCLLLFSLLIALSHSLPPQTPIIGIFTLSLNPQSEGNLKTQTDGSYFAASYVKFVEMGGAQVVPIFSFSQTSQVIELLGKINGVLFTGGSMDFDMKNQWTKNADAILKYAMEQNDKGNVFPIWATCLGIQLMGYLTSNYGDILSNVHGDNEVVLPITVTDTNSYIFSKITSEQNQKMTKGYGFLFFNHNFAILVDTYNKNVDLKNFWTLTATATSLRNQEFVAVFEARKYPFYAVQFHPQKNVFEWKVPADRSLEGVEVVQQMANLFVQKARQNKNSFSNEQDFTQQSIYNYHTSLTTMSFVEIYKFPENPRMHKQ